MLQMNRSILVADPKTTVQNQPTCIQIKLDSKQEKHLYKNARQLLPRSTVTQQLDSIYLKINTLTPPSKVVKFSVLATPRLSVRLIALKALLMKNKQPVLFHDRENIYALQLAY